MSSKNRRAIEDAELFERYLRILEINEQPSGLAGLKEVVEKHLIRVPFENISKFLLFGSEQRGRPLTLSEFLDGIQFHDLGGTCHSNNPYLGMLLAHLGYKVALLGADMTDTNVHTCLRVYVGGQFYHVDVGYAAPFREPIALYRVPYRVDHGCYRYVFDRVASSLDYEVSIFEGDDRIHGYVVHGPPRSFGFFEQTISESFTRGKTFMSYLRITRFFKDRTVELKNRTLITYRGSEMEQVELSSIEEIENAIKTDLAMPRCPLKKALSVLEALIGKSLFNDESCPDGF